MAQAPLRGFYNLCGKGVSPCYVPQYIVVLHHGEWNVRHDGKHYGPYRTDRESWQRLRPHSAGCYGREPRVLEWRHRLASRFTLSGPMGTHIPSGFGCLPAHVRQLRFTTQPDPLERLSSLTRSLSGTIHAGSYLPRAPG